MNATKFSLKTILTLGIIQMTTPVPAEPPAMISPPTPPQITDVTPIKTQRRAIYSRDNDQDVQRLLLEDNSLAYAKNALNESGIATGKADPVLMKLISGPGLNSVAISEDREQRLTSRE